MTSPGAIGDGNDLCIFRIVRPSLPFSIAPSPLHQTSTTKRCPSSKNLSAVFKIPLGTSGNPLRGLDMHQIEVGFLYLLRGRMKGGGGLQKGILQPISTPCSASEQTPPSISDGEGWRRCKL